MDMHTTNYYNTFIQIAEDCPIDQAAIPPLKPNKKSIANYQFEMICNHPYQYNSDEIIFSIFAIRKEIPSMELEAARDQFFSKGQPCLRSSPLPKRYGWGIHYNEEGKVAIYAIDSEEYQKLSQDSSLDQIKAMRSSRKK